MDGFLVAGIWDNRMWFALPLIVAVSLVYAATRHEEPRPILRQALGSCIWMSGFLLVIFLLLFWLSSTV